MPVFPQSRSFSNVALTQLWPVLEGECRDKVSGQSIAIYFISYINQIYDRETPLHLACIRGDAKVVKALLNAGANPDARATAPTSLDMTPLTWCAYAGYDESIALMLGSGAKPNLVVRREDGGRLTALDIARKIGDRGKLSAQLLEDAGAKTWEEIKAAASPFDPPAALLPPSREK